MPEPSTCLLIAYLISSSVGLVENSWSVNDISKAFISSTNVSARGLFDATNPAKLPELQYDCV